MAKLKFWDGTDWVTTDANNADKFGGLTPSDFVKKDGSVTMSGPLTLPADPTNAMHAATKQYVDALKQGLSAKNAARLATTTTINLTTGGLLTIDGAATVVNDRILVKDQTTAAQNGIYVVQSGAWTRADDFDAAAEIQAGAYIFVEEGAAHADSGWVLTTDGTITVGTTALNFTQFSGAGIINAGAGLTKSGNTISISNTGVTANTYKSVTVNAQGQVTGGTNPTTLAGYGISDAAPSTHVGATGTAHGAATTSVNGFMSATDKSKLDGIQAGAQVNTVTSVAGKTGAVTLSASDVGALAASGKATDSSKINGITYTVGTSVPTSPATNDIWIDTN